MPVHDLQIYNKSYAPNLPKNPSRLFEFESQPSSPQHHLTKKSALLNVRGNRIGVSAAAKLSGEPVPAMLCCPGSKVYLLTPRYNAEGLPDFEDMRRMWRYLRTLCREGSICSAFATGHDGAAPALKAITARCGFAPHDGIDPSILNKNAAGGFVVETPCDIEGIFIGYSTEKTEISQ